MQRSHCDLSHRVLQQGRLNRLKCISRIPVLAGDSFEIDTSMVLRLSTLRNPMPIDFTLDVFGFYCPLRWTYPDFRSKFSKIMDPSDNGVTFKSVFDDLAAGTVIKTGLEHMKSLLLENTSFPSHYLYDYYRIFNAWFADPADATEENDIDDIRTTYLSSKIPKVTQEDGYLIAQKKTWPTALNRKPHEVTDVKLDGGKLAYTNLRDLKREQEFSFDEQWKFKRYEEFMKSMFDVRVSAEITRRPELIMQGGDSVSSVDVNDTDKEGLGNVAGKSVTHAHVKMPRKFFAEHGTIYIFAVVRPMPFYFKSRHYLDTYAGRTAQDVLAGLDPRMPISVKPQDLFTVDPSLTTVGYVPDYQWFRTHPHYCDDKFKKGEKDGDPVKGWPVIDPVASMSAKDLTYGKSGDWDNVFQSKQLGHWQSSIYHGISAIRPIPGPDASIYGDL